MGVGLLLGGRADNGHQDSTFLQHLPGAGLRVTAHSVKDDIDIVHRLLEPHGLIIDDFIYAQIAEEVVIPR